MLLQRMVESGAPPTECRSQSPGSYEIMLDGSAPRKYTAWPQNSDQGFRKTKGNLNQSHSHEFHLQIL